jgi:hypothetical protein
MTNKRYSEEDLAVTSELWSETSGLTDKGEWLWLDMVAVPTASAYRSWTPRHPRYRRGWTFALPRTARFTLIPFNRRNGTAAVGVVVRDQDEDIWVTWFDAARAREAEEIADRLNGEIIDIWRHWESVQSAASAGAVDRTWVALEQGHEYAPDAPWGLETIRFATDGALTYERRQRGSRQEIVEGVVDRERVAKVFDELKQSGFPAVPKHPFPPGATVFALSVGDDSSADAATVRFDRRFGLGLPHYGVAIRDLMEITAALRTNDATVLAAWGAANLRRGP